ncbi:MAG: hypothetical protein H0T83_01190, partial [Chthoniobacterales bacterium]|nr:hypothetical protein [Chthoniobacterales bacterium]
ERLAAAESVKVGTDLLGLEMGMSIEAAQENVDSLTDPTKPFVEEGGDDVNGEKKQGEEEHGVVWQLSKSDYSSIYIKADEEDRITISREFCDQARKSRSKRSARSKRLPSPLRAMSPGRGATEQTPYPRPCSWRRAPGELHHDFRRPTT